MPSNRRFTEIRILFVITVVAASLGLCRICDAQSDAVSVFLDQGYYYGSVYDPRYAAYGQVAQPYGPTNGNAWSQPAYPSRPADRIGFRSPGRYTSSNQMGPYISNINGPLGSMNGLYTQRYYSPYGVMTYYGTYGYRGFDQ